MSKTVRFITYTAMGIALVVAAQWLGNMLPAGAVIAGPFAVKQLVTGSLVNCILFVYADRVGLGSAVTVGILSAVLASVIGVGPQVLPLVPLIAVGNALLAFLYWHPAGHSVCCCQVCVPLADCPGTAVVADFCA